MTHTEHVQMHPRSIFDRLGWTVEEEHFAFVPTLVRLAHFT